MNVIVKSHNWNDKEKILSDWKYLSLSFQTPLFLDKIWVENWLESLDTPPQIIEAKVKGKLVGLCFLFRSKKQYFKGVFTIEQLWLHRTGNPSLDQIWIEHNDFLLDKEHADVTRKAMLDYLKSSSLPWHELYVGMSPMTTISKFSQSLGSYRTIVSSPDYSVDLTNMTNRVDYLSSLSKNTRSQIRRTLKLLQQEGDVELIKAESEQQKVDYFVQMSKLHQSKWRDSEQGSGFDNPKFVDFHKKLIFDDVRNFYTGLYALSVNAQPLAYLYILQSENTWSFYLSGIQTHANNKIKIGLLAHTLVIEQAIKNKMSKYTFLAGEARYKQSLSNIKEEDQALVCFSQGSILLKFIQQLRTIKQYIFSRQSN